MISKENIKYLIVKFVYTFFTILPIKKNRVIFSSFSGKRYGDSPKYISEELHKRNKDIEIIWSKYKGYEFEAPEYIKVVKNPSLEFFYYLATSKVWVDSHLKRLWMKKRKNQFFLETWHGGLGFKKIQSDVGNETFQNTMEMKCALYTAKIADVFLSNSEWISNIYKTGFKYNGEIVSCGLPKNDIFFKDNAQISEKIRKFYKIPENKKIILYAPTFRDNPKKSDYDIDFKKIKQSFQLKYGKECVFFVRMHPLMIKESESFYEYSEDVINTTLYSDSQEILIASDFIITDYSSIIFDFMLMKKPGFLFMPDYDEYVKERGFYVDLNYYPFPAAKSNDELVDAVSDFDESEYLSKIDIFSNNVKLNENGKASEISVNIVLDVIEGKR